ncbi:hypothetical protein J5N97_013939 [Dioscorea zingiberensis]|uniref:Uncharacterized protein n=1 Tax=Dioscorea zingiberensis TaxID=325984 RepID=A0A9D5HJ25_9LILI|nr:hypothetical protein J5N97_013939 [Dioscorea zingiberensis]
MSSSLGSATVRVEKATSDLLIGPDWTMNIDICDTINSDHWQAKDVVKAVKKRLQHKNPKVQFLALTLLETMIKNCGDSVHHQVVERDVMQEMIKIVRKKTDMQVREKILVLLDSWQEAFGGPGGKYPQYYWAYTELKRDLGWYFQSSADSTLIFTPPATHPTAIPRHLQANYGMPNNSSMRLDEAMASEIANLSLSGLDGIRSVMELLSEMFRAVNPNDREAVKDEVITDLVSQCRSNQKRVLQLVNTTGDEELLGQALTLNDRLQSLLAMNDAIASGSPLPIEASTSSPVPSVPVTPPSPGPVNQNVDEEEDEDDEFTQLARRNSKLKQASPETREDLETNGQLVPISTTSTETEASSSTASNALALPDPPTPVRTTKEEDLIDLLSITLVTNPSSPHTPITPSSTSNFTGSPLSASSNEHGYPYNPQPYTGNQAYIPYNSYVAPWAQPAPSPLQPQLPSAPAPPQPQLQVPQYPSSYPPPPWATPTSYRVPLQAQVQQYQRPDVPAYYNGGDHQQLNVNQRTLVPGIPPKPYVPSYRLFEDLIELRNPDGSLKVRSTPPSLSGGRK